VLRVGVGERSRGAADGEHLLLGLGAVAERRAEDGAGCEHVATGQGHRAILPLRP
jgi:hypothetical protein